MAEENKELSSFENSLCFSLRACQKGIVINSPEEPRVLKSVIKASQHLEIDFKAGRNVIFWSAISTKNFFFNPNDPVGKRVINTGKTVSSSEDNFAGLPYTPYDTEEEKANQEPLGFMQILNKFTEKGVDNKEKRFRRTILVLADVNSFISERPDNAVNIRYLRECMYDISGDNKCIILLGNNVQVPLDLQNEFVNPEYPLPTFIDLKKYVSKLMQDNYPKMQLENEAIENFSRGCTGLTESTARQTLFNALVEFKGINKEAVSFAFREKEQIVKRSGIAEIMRPRGGLEMLGGMQYFKEYVHEVDEIHKNQEAAIKYGAKVPSGIMLMGVSGTGKSKGAEALGGYWNLPILKLDMGRMFGSLVGQSEGNFRAFQELAKAIAPCLVFVDEFEKGIGGGGEHDGGTSERVKGSLLSWLQDKPDNIVVVATVNSIEPFERNPEMLRAGRFDSIWFVDLPDAPSREEIFRIHLNKVKHLHDTLVFTDLVRITKGYSGAEIENIVANAVRRAFKQKLEHPSTELLLASVKEQVPLSKTMTHVLKKLREYCQDGKARRAGAPIENEELPVDTSKPNLFVENTGTPEIAG